MIKKIINLFSTFEKSYRIKFIYIQLFIFVSSILEIAGIFSVGPLIQLINDPDIIYDETQFISKIYNFLDFETYKKFLIFVVISIFIILLVSTTILSFIIYYLCMFSANLGNLIRSRLFRFFILQPWIYHTDKNSSEYIKKISYECERVTNQIILPILVTNAKFFTGVLIIVALTIYNPLVSASCFLVFSLLYGLVFKVLKFKIDNLGKLLGVSQSKMYRIMSQSFGGIKEAIIYGNQKKYFDEFFKNGIKYSSSDGKIQFLAQVPRYILELLAFSIILSFILILVYLSGNINFDETLPILAIYIFAGYKLLPIFQSIYVGIVQIRANLPALDSIQNEILDSKSSNLDFKIQDQNQNSLKLKNEISLKNVTFFYKKESEIVLKDLSLDIKPKTINYIVGPSGSGKSTLLDLILGLIFPKKGEIYIDDKKLNFSNSKEWHKHIGYVGQNVFLIDDTIKNNITFANDEDKINPENFNNALENSDVNQFLQNLSSGINTIVGERGLKLSGGQRQRIAIARALYQDKDLLFFDEATNSLDGISENFIIQKFKSLSQKKTIIVITHNIKLLKNADMIYLLDKGSVVKQGKYKDLENNELFQKLLNEEKK